MTSTAGDGSAGRGGGILPEPASAARPVQSPAVETEPVVGSMAFLTDGAARIALEYALAAILDCHTRIVAKHVPSPRVRRVRAGYRDRSLRASLALRSERR